MPREYKPPLIITPSSLFYNISSINGLSIAIIIVIGYVLAYQKWFNENSTDLIVKIVIKISLPPLLFGIIMENFNRDQLINSLRGLSVPLLSIFILYILGVILAKIMHVQN